MEKKKLSKGMWIGIIAAIGIVIVAAAFFINRRIKSENGAYRSIMIYEVKGDASITREKTGEIKAAENLKLQSGDKVTVAQGSSLRLKMDDDKYMMLEENTVVTITATGDRDSAKTTIHLEKGVITNVIKNKLNSKSSYEVITPNSIMAVRGTVFRVEVLIGEDGKTYTKLSTFEGNVVVRLINPDGEIEKDEVEVKAGEEIIIEGTKDYSAYVENPKVRTIAYKKLTKETLLFLRDVIRDGQNLCITEEEIVKLLEEMEDVETEETETEPEELTEEGEEEAFYTVTFQYEGKVFGTQEVKEGETAMQPKLNPAASGAWDFDFSTPIESDTVISWK